MKNRDERRRRRRATTHQGGRMRGEEGRYEGGQGAERELGRGLTAEEFDLSD